MYFFEKLGDTITTKGKEVSGKAKDLAEIASLKSQISTCEDVIKKNYIEIGRRYYEKHAHEPEEEYDEFCRAVSNAKAGIEDLEERIKKVKGI
ncbi:MAG: zinc ribbon domain-containing protein [Lachnospiraceae bacterium]|nr:zinc ribbon domain-containing protein [Lachnospiraceae bacterium]